MTVEMPPASLPVRVSDSGPGFSYSDPASRGMSSAGSTGLGLDIARRIAETSGGTLTVARSPHGGGAVTIGLGSADLPALRRGGTSDRDG
jgi:signal transduction histidine kinase